MCYYHQKVCLEIFHILLLFISVIIGIVILFCLLGLNLHSLSDFYMYN